MTDWSVRLATGHPLTSHTARTESYLATILIFFFFFSPGHIHTTASAFFHFAEYVQKYATEEALTKSTENGNASSSDESSMSDFSDDDETRDMEM